MHLIHFAYLLCSAVSFLYFFGNIFVVMHSFYYFLLFFLGDGRRGRYFSLLFFLLGLLLLFCTGFKLIFQLFMINFLLSSLRLILNIVLKLLLELWVYSHFTHSLFVYLYFLRIFHSQHPCVPRSILPLEFTYNFLFVGKLTKQLGILLIKLLKVRLPLPLQFFFSIVFFIDLLLYMKKILIGKTCLRQSCLAIFNHQMVLSYLSLYFSDLGTLLSIVVDYFHQPLQKLFLIVLVRQIIKQFVIFIVFSFLQDLLLVNELRAQLLSDFEIIFLMYDIFDIIFCTLKFECFNPAPQLPHQPLLDGNLLKQMVMIILLDLFFNLD